MTNRAKELRRKRRRRRKARKSRLVYVVNYGGRLRETFHKRMACRSLMPRTIFREHKPEFGTSANVVARERQWALDAGLHPCSLCCAEGRA